MVTSLTAVEIHLWILTGVVFVLILANILCNLRHSRRSNGYRKMERLWEAGKAQQLLEYANVQLRRAPASSFPLMYKTMALLRLRRLDEAEATAKEFMDAAPTMRDTANSLVGTITDLRKKLES